jgi:hypothetical protein
MFEIKIDLVNASAIMATANGFWKFATERRNKQKVEPILIPFIGV